MSTQRGHDPESLGSMVSGLTEDVSSLVRDQIALTKAELSQSAKTAAASSVLFIVAAALAGLGFVFLLVTAAYGLVAAGLPTWAGFGIVTLLLIIVAGITGYLGRNRAQMVKPPERAIAQLEQTKAVLSRTPAA